MDRRIALMGLNFSNIIFLTIFSIIFIICVKHIKKHSDTSKLSWRKLFLEFLVANLIFIMSSLVIGLFGVKITQELFGLFVLFFLLIIPVIVGALYYIYGKARASKKWFGGIEHLVVFNRLYELTVLANIILWLKPKIF